MDEDIKQAIEILKKGGVILYPTDTVWGLGCDATNDQAVRKIYEIKQRIESKAMIVMVDTVNKLDQYVQEVPDIASDLIEAADKPLTIIYDRARNLAPSLLAGDGSIAIRVTNESFSKNLCFRFRKPLVSTSANISGDETPRNFSEISSDIILQVDYVVKYRQEEKSNSAPSSMVKLSNGGVIKIIRP